MMFISEDINKQVTNSSLGCVCVFNIGGPHGKVAMSFGNSTVDRGLRTGAQMPDWVPAGACHYLAHTEGGQSIRTLARAAGVHASTVLRQVRRIEMRRDDPLVDTALSALAVALYAPVSTPVPTPGEAVPGTPELARESCRVLRRLCETGAVLAVAEKMEKAVVVRDTGADGAGARTAVVARAIAQAMALQDWISCSSLARISRYRITAAGRAALAQMLAAAENRAIQHQQYGFDEARADFSGAFGTDAADAATTTKKSRQARYIATESPLCALARRKDRDGNPFLDADLVQSGERLREDFELAQMGPRVTRNWDQLLTGGTENGSGAGGPQASHMASDRMARALGDLGPGLSDVALRCCCYLEGLEVAEKRMGWSARSGKIVLRIALQRLQQHYTSLSGRDQMIG